MVERIILHVDMDAFFASVEAKERPELTDLPLVIGANPKGGKGRGVVSTANYAARQFGIHSAMPISKAYQACPEAVFLRPNSRKYKSASLEVMEVLRQYADVLEQVGVDEAYLDVTTVCENDWGRVPAFCRSLQAAVKRATGLSCSVGAAHTKSIAKIASDKMKPHGVTVVPPKTIRSFLDPLPVKLINGCGPKTTNQLREQGFETIHDLVNADPEYIIGKFGKHGNWLLRVASGLDERPVNSIKGPAKSRSNERTYHVDERGKKRVNEDAINLLNGLLNNSRDPRAFATITIKLRYHDFTTLTRAHTLSIPLIPGAQETLALAKSTVEALLNPLLDGRPVRLIGVRLSNFSEPNGQQSLLRFASHQERFAVPKSTSKS